MRWATVSLPSSPQPASSALLILNFSRPPLMAWPDLSCRCCAATGFFALLMCLLILAVVLYLSLKAPFKYNSEANRISLGPGLATRSAAASAFLYPSLLLPPESHVRTTRPPSSSTRDTCRFIFVIIRSAHCVVLWIAINVGRDSVKISAYRRFAFESIDRRSSITVPTANNVLSASARYLLNGFVFICYPLTALQATSTPKLAFMAVPTNRVMCWELSDSILPGIC